MGKGIEDTCMREEPPFSVYLLRSAETLPYISLKFSMEEGQGFFRIRRLGVLMESPLKTSGEEGGLGALGEVQFVHLWGTRRQLWSFNELDSGVIQGLPVGVWLLLEKGQGVFLPPAEPEELVALDGEEERAVSAPVPYQEFDSWAFDVEEESRDPDTEQEEELISVEEADE
jgi:hypothetical protein